MDNKNIFIQAIHEKKMVKIVFDADEKGQIERECIPFDFGPGRAPGIRYHFYDLYSPDGPHPLSILPIKLIKIEIIDKLFDPAKYVTWRPPYNWHISRDWGQFS